MVATQLRLAKMSGQTHMPDFSNTNMRLLEQVYAQPRYPPDPTRQDNRVAYHGWSPDVRFGQAPVHPTVAHESIIQPVYLAPARKFPNLEQTNLNLPKPVAMQIVL